MKEKNKRRISNTVTAIVGVYGFLWYLHYGLPVIAAWGSPILNSMGEHFVLIPVAVVLCMVGILGPVLALIVALYLIEMVMFKLLGVPLEP